ncbi:MAG: hypothetical protein ACRENP_20815 [Longimicrobiales bacterium]
MSAAAPLATPFVPQILDAHEPPEARGLARDGVRMLVSNVRADTVQHRTFPTCRSFSGLVMCWS